MAVAWLFGLASFVAADGHFEAALPRQRAQPTGIHNFSLWELGPTVRASSYLSGWNEQHHPLFLVDGRQWPGVVEKWASAQGDRHPWVEILWQKPHDLERVVLRHAGWRETPAFTARRYAIRCLTATGQDAVVTIAANEAAVAAHELPCRQARGIRLEFERNDDDIVRLFEVETWGR